MFGGEWPSPSKLQKLRDAGIVPCSRFACACAALAVGLCFVPGFTSAWGRFLGAWRGVWKAPAGDAGALLQRFGQMGGELLFFLLAPAAAAALAILGIGLLQTGFMARADLIGFRLERLNPFHRRTSRWAPGGLLGGLLFLAAALALSWVTLTMLLPWLVPVLGMKAPAAAKWPYLLYERAVLPLMLAVGGGAAAGWLSARLAFRARHRMTRKEVEQENREKE